MPRHAWHWNSAILTPSTAALVFSLLLRLQGFGGFPDIPTLARNAFKQHLPATATMLCEFFARSVLEFPASLPYIASECFPWLRALSHSTTVAVVAVLAASVLVPQSVAIGSGWRLI